MKFSPQLNLRSSYNFLKSLIKIPDYINFAVQNSFSYAFYSEHNSMFGVAEFIKLAKKNNIKPIIGLTLEIDNNPTILIAKNRAGYLKLNFLSADLNDDSKITDLKKDLFKYLSADLIVVTNDDSIRELISSIEGLKIYFNVISLHRISYLNDKQFDTFTVLNAISNNIIINDVVGVLHEHYLSDEEINTNFDVASSNQKLKEISDIVNFELFNNSKMNLIKFITPENIPAKNFLEKLTRESLNSYFKHVKKKNSVDRKYTDRLNYELNIINTMGFENYFLVVWDYVKYAKDHNIMVGPGRGSAAGSLVSFLLRITTIDPIEYDLLFERFLNPERITMPDIDIDFQDDRRDEVIEYLFEKYGPEHLATIITYQSIGPKSSIRDVSRVLGIDLKIVGDITKQMPSSAMTLDIDHIISNSKILQQYENELPELFFHAKQLIGLPRQTGTHAAGIVLTNHNLRELIPIRLGYNGIYQTQFDMNYLEELGLIKMDILGLRNLSTLQNIKTNIFRSKKEIINFNEIPLKDEQTYKSLRAGNTSGIFQLESAGMTRVVVDMKVNSIEDLSAASALYRPGPQEMIPEYIKRKNSNKSEITFLIDPSLIDILGPTYGIIVYQEQVIQMLVKVAGMSLGKADVVRRGMSKKDYEKLHSAKTEFIDGAIKNNYSRDKAITIWDWIESFASYGFNKSHSIAYSYISYWLAYLKIHYSAEFYCSLLNGVMGNVEKTSQYIKELNSYGIKLIAPSVKNINFGYIGINKNIIMPLTQIKGIGSEFIRKLREQYQIDKTFLNSIFKFASAMVKKGLTQSIFNALAWSGAFDIFGIDRGTLVANFDLILSFAKFNEDLSMIQEALYPELEKSIIDNEILVENEKDYVGFYLSSHPIEKIRNDNSNLRGVPITRAFKMDGYTNVVAYVLAIRLKKDKNDNMMAFIELMDETDNISVTVFSKIWDQIKYEFAIGSVIAVEIKVEEYNAKKSGSITKLIKVIRK